MHVRPYLTSLTLLFAGLAIAAPVRAQMFRGDAAHTGVYADPGGRTFAGLRWRVPTDGDVVSSPTVARDRVYVGSGDGFLYAIASETGEIAWHVDLRSPIASSPAVGGQTVYVTTRDGRLHALDASHGRARWQIATGADMPLPWGHESGDRYVSSPTLAGDVVLFGSGDGGVYAVDARTGTQRWKTATQGRVRSTPAVWNGRVFVGSYDGHVYALDLANGRVVWRYATEGASLQSGNFGYDRRSVQSSPAVANGVVYVGARDGFLYAIDARDGTLKWRADHKISWVNSSPAVAGGLVIAGSSDGRFVHAVDAATGTEKWRTPMGLVWSSPAVADRAVIVGDWNGRLLLLDRDTGEHLADFRTGGAIFSSPAVSNGTVFFGSNDGGVYALRLTSGTAPKRAVFFDSTLARYATVPNAADLRTYLRGRGYEVLDGSGLPAFLEARAADRQPSVIVFAIDVLPDALAGDAPERSSLAAYLRAGGKVVWLGLPPLLWPRDPATGTRLPLNAIKWSAPEQLLGVPHDAAIFDVRSVRRTAAGARWGLAPRWTSAWGVAPGGVTQVLGLDDWGLAAAWVRNYGGPAGTGFVRIPPDEPLAVYLAAEYRP